MNRRLARRGMVCLLLLASACQALSVPTARPSADLPASSATPFLAALIATDAPSMAPTPVASTCVRREDTGMDITAEKGISMEPTFALWVLSTQGGTLPDIT